MDYRLVYDAFIEGRRARVHAFGAYTERHHIVPRSVGGGDGPENLIDLSAEDHFFAHLLLARIYGGPLWCALALMLRGKRGGRQKWSGRRSRRRYGWVMRAAAAARSGKKADQYDHVTRHLIHKDGREWRGTQNEMQALGMKLPLANMLVKRKIMCQRWVGGLPTRQPIASGERVVPTIRWHGKKCTT